ncbi:MAG: ABC transporter permease [Nitrospinae bacterium]|nr:ABC transporter permease [Nitrospinota bacterium]
MSESEKSLALQYQLADEFPEKSWKAELLGSIWRQKSALIGVVLLTTVLLVAILAPLLAPMDPAAQSLNRVMKPPMWSQDGRIFILGTDHLGRDLLSRLIYGSRVSIIVGFTSVLISAGTGLVIGLLAGYFGGRVDYILMRVADFVLAFPAILLALAIISVFGASLFLIIVVISLRLWTIYARIVRGNVLKLRETEFIIAAHAMGSSHSRIIFRHILPNVMAPIIIIGSLYLGRMIVIEAGLSFLGLGVPPPTPTWGGLLSEGRIYIAVSWWIVTFPGLAITITVMATNLVGDWLRNYLDPRFKAR